MITRPEARVFYWSVICLLILMHSFLSISIVIYFHSQVVDGQRKIISLLQEQIENVRRPYLCVTISSVHLMAVLTNEKAQFDQSGLSSSFSMLFAGRRG